MKVSGCLIGSAVASAALCGCVTHPQPASQVVQILTLSPANVEEAAADNKKTLQTIGGLVSVLGGAMAGNNMYRASTGTPLRLSITYLQNGQTLTSIQAGRLCEFTQGDAVVIETSSSATRIQPNASCVTLAAK